MRPKLQFVLATILISSPLFGQELFGQERNWSDNTGQFNIEAELVKVEDRNVVLRRSNGKEVTVPLRRLSGEDRKFVRQWQDANSPNENKGDATKAMDEKPVEKAAKEKTDVKATGSSDKPSDQDDSDKTKTDWQSDIKVSVKAKREAGIDFDYNSGDPMPEIVATVEIYGKAAAGAISYGNVSVESFKDDKGNVLLVADNEFGADIIKEMDRVTKRGDDYFAAHPTKGIRFELKSIDASGKVKSISELKGEIELKTGGSSKTTKIEDVSTHKQQKLDDELLKELDINCEFSRSDTTITVKLVGDINKLASMKFVDKNGKEIEPAGWSSGGWKKSWTYTYDFEKIPKADFVMDFRIDAEKVIIPFVAQDIPINK